ncbi:hypothetical protein SELMODRAFT_409837 [Selaginella moellendorffii]|uniref:Uncharacterized protein n=2 Tax=Selaginella moellendorffii TaxID=88036 RepID=D8RCL7_SELML|nr:hypothetical protein SELMODRAFT_409837 [Selaginella moellendorffii]
MKLAGCCCFQMQRKKLDEMQRKNLDEMQRKNLDERLDEMQRKLDQMEAHMKTFMVSGSSSVMTSMVSGSSSVATAVNPPPGALDLLRFVGTCDNKGTALFIGLPDTTLALSPQPTCIVVGYKDTIVWKEGEEVTVTINGQTVKGEVVSLVHPWVAAVELLEPLKLPGVPLMPGGPQNEEAVFVRRAQDGAGGVELPAIIKKLYLSKEPAGIVPGVQTGDIIVRWDSAKELRVSGIVVRTDEDGSVYGLPIDNATVFFMEAYKKDWYRVKYPGRLQAVAQYRPTMA